MASRPVVTVFSSTNGDKASTATLPAVFRAPIRTDVVTFVHDQMHKNRRQAYAVYDHFGISAGHQHSAESWGTGRAVARIPRISGGGTSRSGQGAFGNMCRKGRMFNPTKVWRHWHRRINQNQRRYATVSALAASALPALVEARGHRISGLPQVPLVVDNSIEKIATTKKAIALLKSLGAYADVEKSAASGKLRPGVGKIRNRRHVIRHGPLIVYNKDDGVSQGFRNLPGVDLCSVKALNLLKLAPGGHVGRFIIWSADAFNALDGVFGTGKKQSTQKHGYNLPVAALNNADIARIINSDEVQAALRPTRKTVRHVRLKKNPLKNLNVLFRLNPYAKVEKRKAILSEKKHREAFAKANPKKKGVAKAKVAVKKAAAPVKAAAKK